MSISRHGQNWSRDELILALYLYCQIPIGRAHSRNLEVQQMAAILERTPASIARKLGNFAAFDPVLAARGVSGLIHGGKGDREVWEEFHADWNSLVDEALRLMAARSAQAVPTGAEDAPIASIPSGESERVLPTKIRLHQAFFRRAVLSSYGYSCCVCSLDLQPLLVASHIIPWAADENRRADPQNGLSLCALHDKAFDRGLMTVGADFTVRLSPRVLASKSLFAASALAAFAGQKIVLPARFAPNPKYLEWHGANVFER